MKSKILISVISFLISVIIFSSCSVGNAPYQEARISLGTYVTIKVQDLDKTIKEKKDAVSKTFLEIERIEELLSSFKDNNIIAKINNSDTNEVFLDDDTLYVLERAKYFYEVSGGAFDITVMPILELWGFHDKKYRVPSDEEIKETLKRIGSDKMILNKENRSVRFSEPGMKIDLGGIAKGYAVDRAIYILKENGIKNALVAAAGDIYCMGERGRGESWTVGIRNPAQKNRITEKVNLKDMAMSTSGGYENYFEVKGKRYSHIIDPKTGWPVENDLLSVTVIATDNITADALATTIFVLGKAKGFELLKKFAVAQARVIDLRLR